MRKQLEIEDAIKTLHLFKRALQPELNLEETDGIKPTVIEALDMLIEIAKDYMDLEYFEAQS